MIDDRLVAMAARCARRAPVKKVEAAVMMREAWDELRRLRGEVETLRGRIRQLVHEKTALELRGD